MDKIEIFNRLKNKIIAVIRAEDSVISELMAKTIIENGIGTIEMTFTISKVSRAISHLRETHPDAVIGAGSVLSVQQANDALQAGAQFVVSPCVVEEVGEFCKTKDVFCSLGAQTPTEVYMAYLHGGKVVKLFPGELFEPSIIKALHGPFPYIDFMPTGGINKNNAKLWLDSGAFALGVGGYLTNGINENNLDLLGLRVKELLNSLKE